MSVAPTIAARAAPTPLALRIGTAAAGDLTFLRQVRGGHVLGTVVAHTSGSDHFASKHLGGTRIEDFQLQLGIAMSSGLFDWIAASWGANPPAHDGAVLGCDLNYVVRSERAFTAALISETAFPACDAASKATGLLTIRLTPRELLPITDPNTKLTIPIAAGKQKLWQTSNFRLQIDGLDCSKVTRVAAFTVRRTIERVSAGGGVVLQAGPIDFPSLRITFAASTAPSWVAWHQDFVVAGNNGPGAERTGSLSLLAPNLAVELARVDFAGLGIFRLTSDPDEDAAPSQVARMTADLYCEQMALLPGGAP
jgi:hypothetical protein